MRYRDGRRSLCLSSQSGCPLTCTFCATGAMKFGRNLTASEILDQALHFRRIEAVDHCVFMGMGEPMMNLDNVLAACRRLPDVGITHRRTAISTVGWVPGIERLRRVRHADPARAVAARARRRAALADHARQRPLPAGARCWRRASAFYEAKRRKIFIEYVMLAGVNDRYEQALAAGGAARPADLQGQPDPVQPDRLGVRGVGPRGDRGVPRGARGARLRGDRAAHARARHRRGVRAAGGAKAAAA